jgi:YggT family protein
MAGILAYAVYLFTDILMTALLVRALMSWFVRDYYSPIGKIYRLLINFTEPIVEPFRRLLSRFNTGMVDFSLLLAMVAIQFASNIIIRLIFMFL